MEEVNKKLSFEITLDNQSYVRNVLADTQLFLEVEWDNEVFRSALFSMPEMKKNEIVAKNLIRFEFTQLLPFPKNVKCEVKLFMETINRITLVGAETLDFEDYPVGESTYISIRQRHGFIRQVTLKMKIAEAEPALEVSTESIHKNEYRRKTITFLEEYISKQIPGLEDKQWLLYIVALFILKITKSAKSMLSIQDSCLFEEENNPFFEDNHLFLTCCDTKNSIYISPKEKTIFHSKIKSHLKFPQYYSASYSFLPDGSVIVSGGKNADHHIYSQGVFHVHPKKGRFYVLRELEKPRMSHQQIYYRGSIYIIGGKFFDHQPPISLIGRLCLRTNTWHKAPSLPIGLGGNVVSGSVCIYKGMLIQMNVGKSILSLKLDAASVNNNWETYSAKNIPGWKSTSESTIFVHKGELFIFYKSKSASCKLLQLKFNKPKKGDKLVHFKIIHSMDDVEAFTKFVYGDGMVYLFPDPLSSKIGYVDIEKKESGLIKHRSIRFGKAKDNKYTKKGVLGFSSYEEQRGNKPFFYFVDERDFNLYDSSLKRITFGDYNQKLTKKIHQKQVQEILEPYKGIGHTFVNYPDGKQLIFGFFSQITGGLKYQSLAGIFGGYSDGKAYIINVNGPPSESFRPGTLRNKGNVFVAGGLTIDPTKTYSSLEEIESSSEPSKDFSLFDFNEYSWRSLLSLPEGRVEPILQNCDNYIYMIGGFKSKGIFSEDIWRYNLHSAEWENTNIKIGIGITKKSSFFHFSIGDTFYIMNSSEDQQDNVFWIDLSTLDANKSKSTLPLHLRIEAVHEPLDSPLITLYYRKLSASESTHIMNSKRIRKDEFASVVANTSESIVRHLEELKTVDTALDPNGRTEKKKDEEDIDFNSSELTDEVYTLFEHKINPQGEQLLEQQNPHSDGMVYATPQKEDGEYKGCPSKLRLVVAEESFDDCYYLNWLKLNGSSNNPMSKKEIVLLREERKEGKYMQSIYDINSKTLNLYGDISNTNTEFTSTKYSHSAATVDYIDGRMLIVGGEYKEGGKLVATNKLQLYCSIKHRLTSFGAMRYPRIGHSCIRLGNIVYVFGGRKGRSGELVAACESFDIRSGEWSEIGHLKTPRSKFAVDSFPGKIYIFGGEDELGKPIDNIEYYDISKGEFVQLVGESKLHKPLAGLGVVRTSSKSFLYFGGYSNDGLNLEVSTSTISTDCETLKAEVKYSMLYSHVSSGIARQEGKIYVLGGNPLGNCEILTSEGSHDFGFKVKGSFNLVRKNNTLSQTSSFVHSNSNFNKLYIFGIDKMREIWRIDMSDLSWESLRVPEGLDFWDYSICVTLPDGRIVLNGGINAELKEIKKSCFIVTPGEDTVTFESAGDMIKARYTHTSVYLNGHVYVLGGRYFGNGEEGVIHDCERMNIKTKKWEQIANLNIRRCTAVAASYKNHIYIIGGYRGEGRCQSIERYDELRNTWDIIPLLLKYPIEASILVHYSESEVLLLGGKDQYKEQDYVTLYNLEDNTTEDLPFLKESHVLAKGGLWQDKLLVIGGSSNCKVESCSLPGWEWDVVNSVYLMPFKQFSKTSYSQSY